MSALNEYSEDTLVELPTIELLSDMRWETANYFAETFLSGGGSLERDPLRSCPHPKALHGC